MDNFVPRVSPLPHWVVGIKTLVVAGQVTTCDTNFSTGVEGANRFFDLNSRERKAIAGNHHIKPHTSKNEIQQYYSKL